MNDLLRTTKELLSAYNRHAQKRLGQNFLVDQAALDRIVAAAELTPDDDVLEIGCGLGVLTQALASKAKHVTTLDLDREMIQITKEVLSNFQNVNFVHADFLEWLIDRPFTKVVANVPYYITSPIIEKLLNEMRDARHVTRIVLTVQKEVAERICANSGTKKFGSFSVFVQNRADVEIASHISRRSFYPPPNVDSAVLILKPLEHLRYDIKEEVVRAAFSQRRKMIRSTLKKYNLDFEKIGIDSRRRAETLSLEEFERISKET
ncbi:ribosomal RNA small subunit methyltransferase A [Candidatus Saganbacteria bacterium]|nr:ribosomal RNA small subunit methyltransferase A [Candidatus Saganbacteria bacterium]